MGFANYDVYGLVKNSLSGTSDLHLSMAIFCKMRFYRSRESGAVREEVGRGWSWASPKIAGVCHLAFSKSCFHIYSYISVANMQEMFWSFLWCRSSVPSDGNEQLAIIFKVDLTKYINLSFRSLDPKHTHYYLNNLLYTTS